MLGRHHCRVCGNSCCKNCLCKGGKQDLRFYGFAQEYSATKEYVCVHCFDAWETMADEEVVTSTSESSDAGINNKPAAAGKDDAVDNLMNKDKDKSVTDATSTSKTSKLVIRENKQDQRMPPPQLQNSLSQLSLSPALTFDALNAPPPIPTTNIHNAGSGSDIEVIVQRHLDSLSLQQKFVFHKGISRFQAVMKAEREREDLTWRVSVREMNQGQCHHKHDKHGSPPPHTQVHVLSIIDGVSSPIHQAPVNSRLAGSVGMGVGVAQSTINPPSSYCSNGNNSNSNGSSASASPMKIPSRQPESTTGGEGEEDDQGLDMLSSSMTRRNAALEEAQALLEFQNAPKQAPTRTISGSKSPNSSSSLSSDKDKDKDKGSSSPFDKGPNKDKDKDKGSSSPFQIRSSSTSNNNSISNRANTERTSSDSSVSVSIPAAADANGSDANNNGSSVNSSSSTTTAPTTSSVARAGEGNNSSASHKNKNNNKQSEQLGISPSVFVALSTSPAGVSYLEQMSLDQDEGKIIAVTVMSPNTKNRKSDEVVEKEIQVSLSLSPSPTLRFKGLFLYTVDIYCNVEWCI